jgi:hypothetical protein
MTLSSRPFCPCDGHQAGLWYLPARWRDTTPPKSKAVSPQMGMRPSLRGTQASGEGESPTQDANVAEVSYGKPVSGEPEHPDNG